MSALGEWGDWRSQVEDVRYLCWSSSLFFCYFNKADGSLQEGSVFASHRGPLEAWDVLPSIDERIALKFIMAETHLLK